MAPSSGGVAERHQLFTRMKKMQWHLGKDTDPSLPAWFGPQKQRIMVLGDRGPLFFPFERAQGKNLSRTTMSLQSLCAILAHFSKQKHDLKRDVPSAVNKFDKSLCSHVWHAEFPFGVALVAEACSAWNTCFAADGGDARLYCSGSEGAQQNRQKAAARGAVGGISAGSEDCGSFSGSRAQKVWQPGDGSGGQFLEHLKQNDLTYDMIPDNGHRAEEFIEDARGAVGNISNGSEDCGSFFENRPQTVRRPGGGSGGQFFERFKQNDVTYDTIPDDGKGTEEFIGEDGLDCFACDSCEEVDSDEGQGGCEHSVEICSAGNNRLREALREHGVPRDDGAARSSTTTARTPAPSA